MSLEKSLKLINTQTGKVLTTDENGKAISAEINITDIATKDITNNLDSRISQLESSMESAINKITDING